MADRHPPRRLDLSGLLCPLPVLKAGKQLDAMASGEILEVIATDPMSVIDMPHFCSEQGHELIGQETAGSPPHIQDQAQMTFDFGSFNNWGPLKTVAIRDVDAAFVNDAKIDAEWKDLNFHSRPDLGNARREFAKVENLLRQSGAEVIKLPAAEGLTLDSLYTHDALIVTPRGLVKPRMGKPQRRREAAVNGAALAERGMPIAGEITGDGKVEGGDLVWIDRYTLLAGVGYRTNLEGLRQLGELAGQDVEILWFDMPHYKGPSDVFHLMSCLSPLDHDLAVVYPPLMAGRLIEFLTSRGIRFVEVPDDEFITMGCNVLALGPRHAMIVEGNPETVRRMEKAGVKVEVVAGADICRKGEGGPTCMTRPLVRA